MRTTTAVAIAAAFLVAGLGSPAEAGTPASGIGPGYGSCPRGDWCLWTGHDAGGHGVAAALAGCLAVPVVAGAAVAFEDVLVAAPGLAGPAIRAAAVVALALALGVSLMASRGRGLLLRAKALARARPGLLVALGGALLGFVLTLRLGIGTKQSESLVAKRRPRTPDLLAVE